MYPMVDIVHFFPYLVYFSINIFNHEYHFPRCSHEIESEKKIIAAKPRKRWTWEPFQILRRGFRCGFMGFHGHNIWYLTMIVIVTLVMIIMIVMIIVVLIILMIKMILVLLIILIYIYICYYTMYIHIIQDTSVAIMAQVFFFLPELRAPLGACPGHAADAAALYPRPCGLSKQEWNLAGSRRDSRAAAICGRSTTTLSTGPTRPSPCCATGYRSCGLEAEHWGRDPDCRKSSESTASSLPAGALCAARQEAGQPAGHRIGVAGRIWSSVPLRLSPHNVMTRHQLQPEYNSPSPPRTWWLWSAPVVQRSRDFLFWWNSSQRKAAI